jgi:hypothetical protein
MSSFVNSSVEMIRHRAAVRRLGSLAGLAVVLAFVVSALPLTRSPFDLPLFVIAFAIFTAPGWPLARWFLGSSAGWLARVPFALLLGYLVGLTVYVLLRLTTGSAPLEVLTACAVTAGALTVWLRGEQPGVIRLPALTRGDGLCLAALLLAVALIVGPVFANVGRQTPQGLAYRAYFIADLFAHMSVVAELSKNVTPPANPYYPAEPLPYYWSFFTFPAVYDGLHDWLVTPVTVDRGILLTDLCMAGVYVSVWFIVLRGLGASTLAAVSAWLVVLFASSFEGIFFLWTQAYRGRSLWDFRYVNIDAITRWNWDLPPTDGLHRLFWYTPQHGLAITLGFVLFGTVALARRPNSLQRGIIDGLLLGAAFACSSFNGLLLIAAYGLFETALLVLDRFADLWGWLRARAVAAGIVVLFASAIIMLGMVQTSSPGTIFRLNPHFLRGPLVFVALSFGPALLIVPFGLRRLASWSRRAFIAAAAIVCVSIIAFLFVDIRGHENSYVTFRTAQLWYLLSAVLIAAAIDAARAWPRAAAVALWAVVAGGSLLALPTVALDWYNARDIENIEMSVGGFPWTVYISPENQAALAWMATHLPPKVTVEADARARGRVTWALIPAFAKRRMAIGRGIFQPNPQRFDDAVDLVSVVYRTPDIELAYAYCKQLGIQYIYVGPEERAADGPNADKFANDPADFVPVYHTGEVTIYRVKGMKPPVAGGGS